MKVGIVGSGFAGATAGYALVMHGVGRELVLVDKNSARAEAEAARLWMNWRPLLRKGESNNEQENC